MTYTKPPMPVASPRTARGQWSFTNGADALKRPSSESEQHTTQHAHWRLEVSSGASEIDQIHRRLFGALSALAGTDDENFCVCYGDFVSKMESLFREEEDGMDELEPHAARLHIEQHARVLGALHNVHAQIMSGDLPLGRRVTEDLLPQWLAFHIWTMDTTLTTVSEVTRAERSLDSMPS